MREPLLPRHLRLAVLIDALISAAASGVTLALGERLWAVMFLGLTVIACIAVSIEVKR